jgi:hypothetical protein
MHVNTGKFVLRVVCRRVQRQKIIETAMRNEKSMENGGKTEERQTRLININYESK